MDETQPSEPLNQPFGDYVLERRIGAGGMAVTYVARETLSGMGERHVCIKQILPQFAVDKSFRQMFHDEVRVTSLLSHRNICRIYRAGEVEGSLYMAMEYVDGPSVDDLVQIARARNEHVPIEHALYLTAEVMEGLEAAHTQVDTEGRPLQLVHRDVSPQNVLVSRKGDVKVIDFGVAKAASNMSKTRTGAVKGKILYLSPEQLQGKTLDGRSDVFSAGLMLYQILTGTHPFEGPDEHATIFNYISKEIVPPSQIAPHVPVLVDAPVMRALAKERDERFSSAAEMSRALTDALYAVVPSYRPYRFADFIAWSLDPDAGQMPASASTSAFDRTGAGLGDAGTGPGLGENAGQSAWDGEDGFAPTVQTGAIPVAPEFRDHKPAPTPSASGLASAGTAAHDVGSEASIAPVEPAPAASRAQSTSRMPLVVGGIIVALLAIGAIVYFATRDESPSLEGSEAENEEDGESEGGDPEGEGTATATGGDSAGAAEADAAEGDGAGGSGSEASADSDATPPDPTAEDEGGASGDEAATGQGWGYDDEDVEAEALPTDDPALEELDPPADDGAWGSAPVDEPPPEDDGGAWGSEGTDSGGWGNDGGAWNSGPPADDSPWEMDGTDGGDDLLSMSLDDYATLEIPGDQVNSVHMAASVMGAAGTRIETYLRLAVVLSQRVNDYMAVMSRFCVLVEESGGWTEKELQILDAYMGGTDPCTMF